MIGFTRLHRVLDYVLSHSLACDEAEFKEQDHPRDKSGKFGKGGEGATVSKPVEESTNGKQPASGVRAHVESHYEMVLGPTKSIKQKTAFIEKELKVSSPTAHSYAKAVDKYSGSGYFDVRSGRDKKTAQKLEEYIDSAPKWDGNGPVYRGLGISTADVTELVPGSTLDMKGVSSWSSDKYQAQEYARRTPQNKREQRVLVKMDKADTGTSIAHLSQHPGEQEVLLSGHTRMEVVGLEKKRVRHDDGKVYTMQVVRVKEVAVGNAE